MKIAIHQSFTLDFGPGHYARAVEHLLLTPKNGPTQTVESWTIAIDGFENAAQFSDCFGNAAHLLSQTRPEGPVNIEVTGIVDTIDRNGVIGRPVGEPVVALFKRITALTKSTATVHGKFRSLKGERLSLLHGLMGRVGELYRFGPEDDEGAPSPGQSQSQVGQSQSQGSSSPQGEHKTEASAAQFAHAFIGAARALEIPTRYVTGYLFGEDDEESGFHAWAEAYVDELGWVAFDAALGYCPTDRHVRLAIGLDATYAAPVRAVPPLTGDVMPVTRVSGA